MAEQKQHAPTARRLERARREGNVLRSPALPVSVAYAIGVSLLLWWSGPTSWVGWRNLLESLLLLASRGDLAALSQHAITASAYAVLCALAVVAVPLILTELLQVGPLWTTETLRFDPSRCNPWKGVVRIGTTFRDLWQPLLRLGVGGGVLALLLFPLLGQVALMALQPSEVAYESLRRALRAPLIASVFVVLAGALFEYAMRRRAYFRELSMSDQEVREEYREQEGDPMVKSMRRHLHEQMSYQEVVRRVRRAKVIVVDA